MSLVNTNYHMRDCGGENILFFYGEARKKHFHRFLDVVYMSGKIILSILSHIFREFPDTYSSGWDPVVFINEEDDKEVK